MSVTIRAGDVNKMAMYCEAAGGKAPLQYQWEKYQSSSDSWIKPSSRVLNVDSQNLTFSEVTEDDEGIYHCIVSNKDGSVESDNGTVTVYGKSVTLQTRSCTTVKP